MPRTPGQKHEKNDLRGKQKKNWTNSAPRTRTCQVQSLEIARIVSTGRKPVKNARPRQGSRTDNFWSRTGSYSCRTPCGTYVESRRCSSSAGQRLSYTRSEYLSWVI